MEGVLLETHLGHSIVCNVEFTAYVCDCVSTVGAVVWVVRVMDRGIVVLDGSQRIPTARGGFGVFCSPLSQWEMPLDRPR